MTTGGTDQVVSGCEVTGPDVGWDFRFTSLLFTLTHHPLYNLRVIRLPTEVVVHFNLHTPTFNQFFWKEGVVLVPQFLNSKDKSVSL